MQQLYLFANNAKIRLFCCLISSEKILAKYFFLIKLFLTLEQGFKFRLNFFFQNENFGKRMLNNQPFKSKLNLLRSKLQRLYRLYYHHLRPVKMRCRHLSRLSRVVVDGLLPDQQNVDLVLLGQSRQDLADVERLKGLHLAG